MGVSFSSPSASVIPSVIPSRLRASYLSYLAHPQQQLIFITATQAWLLLLLGFQHLI